MKPYSSYKDSGIAWIGQIPSHWKTERAKNIFYREARSVRDSDEVITCFRDGQVTLRKNRRTEGFTESLKEIGYQGIRKGDLVIHQMDAFAGSIGISDSDGKGTPVYICCNPKDSTVANNSYFCHVLREMAKTGFIKSLYRGIRERSSDFRFETFAVQNIPIPPIAEQEAIVRFITEKSEKIDRYIAEQERLLATLDELRQAEIARAVTRGLNPDAPLRDSGIDWIGSIPAHWEKRRYKDILSSEDEKVGDNPITLLSLSKNGGIIIRDLSENKGKFPKDFATYKIVRPGNLVMCLFDVDETPRTVGLSHHHGMITGAYDIFSIRNIDSRFLEYHLLEIDNRKAFKSLYKGLRKTIPTPSLLGSYIYIPPLDDQQAIVEYLDAKTAKIDSMKADIQRQIGLLKEYKQRIIADAVTGKIDVRE